MRSCQAGCNPVMLATLMSALLLQSTLEMVSSEANATAPSSESRVV